MNAICAHFKLLPYSKNIILNNKHKTIPQTRYMKKRKIKIVETKFIDRLTSFDVPFHIIYKPLQEFPSIIISNNNDNNHYDNTQLSPLLNNNIINENDDYANHKVNDDSQDCCCRFFCVVL